MAEVVAKVLRKGVRLRERRLTPNQIIAVNVEEARKQKGWTQFQTVRALARSGLKWSRANYAMAVSSSVKGTRIREFSADEIVAFAQTFDIVIWKLFIPPPGTGMTVALPGGGPVLDFDAMRQLAYAQGELPPPKTKRQAELQEYVTQRLIDYATEKLRHLDADTLTRPQIEAAGREATEVFHRAIAQHKRSK